jgi:hypothetical protein
VDITYGGEGSNISAGSLPFSATTPLDTSEAYYSVQAQLNGSGSVTCTTTVTYSQYGSSHTATQTATASGGYNIANAEVCSGLFESWEAC